MAITELLFGEKQLGRVGVVQFDAMVSETHTDEVDVTSYPVEEGADHSDHVRKLPVTLQLEGVITDTPIVFLSSFFAKTPVGTSIGVGPKKTFTAGIQQSNTRVDDAYQALRGMQDRGEFIDASTTLRQYENMVIKSMAITRDARNGKVLNCQLTLQEIMISKSASIDLPDPVNVANKKKKPKGKKATQEASTEETSTATQNNSALTSLFGG